MPKKFMQRIHMIQEQLKLDKKGPVAPKQKSYDFKIEKNLSVNLKLLQAIFSKNIDVNFREFRIGKDQVEAFFVNIEGLCDKNLINLNILQPLMWESKKIDWQGDYSITSIKKSLVNFNDVYEADNISDAVNGILSGDTALFVAGSERALLVGTRNWEQRGVNQPESESTVRGPREGFTETLRINTSLIRRKIKDPDLMIEMLQLGERTRTDVAIVYVKNIANNKIIDEVKKRISTITIDGVLESGYIESFIEDTPLGLFPTVGSTEVPDKFAAKILEGRIGILVDGTPFALTVPMLFIENFQVPEDYFVKPLLVLQSRLIRYLALHIALFLPGLYVAIITFHPHVLPIALLDTIIQSQAGIPFPAIAETFLVLIFFEALREAGVRIPRPVGQAVSIVGALVLGDAVVSAGLASYPVVIIVALSGIMGFLLPPQLNPMLMLRIPVLIISSILGILGTTWAYVMIIVYLISLRSFGVPYLSPLLPYTHQDMKDAFIRVPWWKMITRPLLLNTKDVRRVAKGQQPQPEEAGETEDD